MSTGSEARTSISRPGAREPQGPGDHIADVEGRSALPPPLRSGACYSHKTVRTFRIWTLGPMSLGAARFGDPAGEFFATADRGRIDLLPPGGSAVVLELGCGKGATGALALKDRRCARWIGVEANLAAANEALYALTDVHAGDLETLDLGYPEGAFDVIFLSQAAAAFARPRATLGRLARLLGPGGWLYVIARDEAGLAPWMAPKRLGKLLKRAGLTAITVRGSGREARARLFRARRFRAIQARGRKP
jgi:SAM-dependent methyltransferase